MTLRVRQYLSTNIQVVDLLIFPSLPQFVNIRFLLILGSHLTSPPNAAFVKNVYHNIYERVRPVSILLTFSGLSQY